MVRIVLRLDPPTGTRPRCQEAISARRPSLCSYRQRAPIPLVVSHVITLYVCLAAGSMARRNR
jgi:hypothetical protein